jgi:lambda repressor-like predicted transcriptional regulator
MDIDENETPSLDQNLKSLSEDEIKNSLTDPKERDSFPEEAILPTISGKPGKKAVRLKDKEHTEKFGLKSPVHPNVLKARERSADIFHLRKQGWTIREIALKYNVHPNAITAIIKREVQKVTKKTSEDLDTLRQIQLERLDFMWKSLWPNMECGNANAIEKGLAVMERQAKLLGLDAPEVKRIDITVEMTETEAINNARMLGIAIPSVLDLSDGTVVNAEFEVREAITDEKTKTQEGSDSGGSSTKTEGTSHQETT